MEEIKKSKKGSDSVVCARRGLKATAKWTLWCHRGSLSCRYPARLAPHDCFGAVVGKRQQICLPACVEDDNLLA